MLKTTGVPSDRDIEEVFPPRERLEKGPVVVVECFETIPCNPCYTACHSGGIEAFKDITDLPTIDFEKCNGCTLCISSCPGLAIMVIDYTYHQDFVKIIIPFEFFPLPKEGEWVKGLDRNGEEVVKVQVLSVKNSKKQDKTPVISIAVPKAHYKKIRNIKVGVPND